MTLACGDGEVDILGHDQAAERLVETFEAQQAHGDRCPAKRWRSQPHTPWRRNITHRMNTMPTHSSQYSVCELTTFLSSRNIAAPIAGPTIVPAPPRITMMIASPDRPQCRMSLDTNAFCSAYSPPPTPAMAPAIVNATSLKRCTG